MRIAKEVRVGIVAIMAITMFVVGFNYLKGQDLFTTTNKYFGIYDKVDGLIASDPVLVNGYKIGSVSDVDMDLKTRTLRVEISIPRSIEIPANSVMRIVNHDMIGAKAVELIWGDTTVLAKDGSKLIAEKDEGIAQAISGVLKPLTQSVNSVLGDIDTAVSGADLEGTLKDASLALRSFKETADKLNRLLDGKDEQVDRIFANIESTTVDLKDMGPRLDSISLRLDETSKSLEGADLGGTIARIDELVAALNTTISAINASEGTLGKLVNDDELYLTLDATLKQLNSLLKDIEDYPSRYTGITRGQRKRADKQKDEATENNP